MTKTLQQMTSWADMYKDMFDHINESADKVNEATPMVTVDDKYIEQATALLADLEKKDPTAFKMAMDKLQRNKGHQLVDVQTFVDNRLKAAGVEPEANSTPTRDELMKQVADKNKAAAPKNELGEQQIKEVWVKSLDVNPDNDSKSVAKIQLTYMDSQKEDVEFSIGTIGTEGGFEQADRLYKELKRSMPGADDLDIRLAMLRVAFNDYRAKWMYGPDKSTDKAWSFANTVTKTYSNPLIKREKKSWLDKSTKNRAVVYRNGNTTIYKTEAEGKTEDKQCNESFTSGEAIAIVSQIIPLFSHLSTFKRPEQYEQLCNDVARILEDYGINV